MHINEWLKHMPAGGYLQTLGQLFKSIGLPNAPVHGHVEKLTKGEKIIVNQLRQLAALESAAIPLKECENFKTGYLGEQRQIKIVLGALKNTRLGVPDGHTTEEIKGEQENSIKEIETIVTKYKKDLESMFKEVIANTKKDGHK